MLVPVVVVASGPSGIGGVVSGLLVVAVRRVVGSGVTVCRGVGVSGWVLPVPTSLPLVVLVVWVGQVVGLVGVLSWGYFHWARLRPSSVRALPARLV
ncbi:hypothetical protein ACIP10_37220, partial [Streptomyces galbus]|uniref:hypothetical protein n=1 Tax=Streptomyces galbus TaxID=33898 RepID=UPI003811EE2B